MSAAAVKVIIALVVFMAALLFNEDPTPTDWTREGWQKWKRHRRKEDATP